jgi:DNA-binding transcriptional MerR regulator
VDRTGRFSSAEYTAGQVAKLLGITPAMVADLERRGLLKLSQGSGTEVYTAGEVVRYLKRLAQTESGADPTRDPS